MTDMGALDPVPPGVSCDVDSLERSERVYFTGKLGQWWLNKPRCAYLHLPFKARSNLDAECAK
jgi:hypothetical protein